MRDQIAARVAGDFQGAGVVVLHGRRRTIADPSHNEHLEALAGFDQRRFPQRVVDGRRGRRLTACRSRQLIDER